MKMTVANLAPFLMLGEFQPKYILAIGFLLACSLDFFCIYVFIVLQMNMLSQLVSIYL